MTQNELAATMQPGALLPERSDASTLDAAIQATETNPMTILDGMVKNKIQDVAVLERMTDLVERWRKEQAAEEFSRAITGFQSEMPMVRKWRSTAAKEGSDFKYKFASYDDVMRVAGPLLAKYKIVVTFDTAPPDKPGICGVCHIRVGRHVETSTLYLPIPQMKANEVQRFLGAVKYFQRGLLCMALNIVTTDEDNDAATQFAGLTDEQVLQIEELLAECKDAGQPVDMKAMYAWLAEEAKTGIAGIDDVPQSAFELFKKTLERKVKKAVGK